MPTVFSSHWEQIEDVQLYKLFVYFNIMYELDEI